MIFIEMVKDCTIITSFRKRYRGVIEKFERSPLWKGVLIIGSGTAFAQLIAVITTPVITRLYSPSDFGLLGIYVAILTILGILTTLKYDYAIPIPKDDDEAAHLLLLCVLVTSAFSFLLVFVIVLMGKEILALFNFPEIAPYFWLIVLGIFGSGLYQALSYWAIRRRDYKLLSFTKINQNIGGSGTKIVLGFFYFGPFGLLFGYLISSIAGIGTLIRSIWDRDLDHVKRISLSTVLAVGKKYWQYPVYAAPGALIQNFSSQIPIFFLTLMFGLNVAGNYALAYQVLSLPLALITFSISQVFHGEAAKNARESPKELKELQADTTRKLAIISLPCIGIPALCAPWLFPVIFGAEWIDAGWYILPLSLVAISHFIVDPVNKLVVYGSNDWDFAFNAVKILLFAGGFLISQLLMFTPMMTLFVYGVLTAVTQVMLFFINSRAIDRVMRNSDGDIS